MVRSHGDAGTVFFPFVKNVRHWLFMELFNNEMSTGLVTGLDSIKEKQKKRMVGAPPKLSKK